MLSEAIHVAVNFLPMVRGATGGMETYARMLLAEMLRQDPSVRFTLVANVESYRSLRDEFESTRCRVVDSRVRGGSLIARVAAEQSLLPRAAARLSAQLIHNPFTTAPIASVVPQVTTIHDLSFARVREAHSPGRRLGIAALATLAAHRSSAVLTVSNFVASDLRRLMRVRAERLYVTPPGPGLPVPSNPLCRDEVLARTGLPSGCPIIFAPCPPRPHKNLGRLLQAIAGLASQPQVIATGYPTDTAGAWLRLAESLGLSHRVRFLGWVDPDLLDGLYRIATAVAFPSLAEGFGLPVLEAMVRGTPVACSNASSLPEVGGDAVLYFEPRSVTAIEHALSRLLGDAELRRRLARRGKERAAQFSWQACARETLAVYGRIARPSKRRARGSASSFES